MTSAHQPRLRSRRVTHRQRPEVAADGRGPEAARDVAGRAEPGRGGRSGWRQYGPNEIAEHKTNPLLKFLSYFWGPIPWMIEVAVILSGAVGHWPDFFIILVLLLANAVVGYTEERQAGNAIDALKAKLAITARVKRDGAWVTPPARELVPGDVIRLRLGDIVPADARLLDGDEIEVDQSALTGESLPATCATGDAVYSGSIVRRGEIGALVYATGTHTYFGKTAELVQDAHTVSHFQKAVLKIGNYLIVLAVAFVVRDRGRLAAARRPDPHHAAVRARAHRRRDPGRDADRAVGDDGRRRPAAGQEAGHRQQAGRDRGTRRRRRALRGQDRHPDPELADPRRPRSPSPGSPPARSSSPVRWPPARTTTTPSTSPSSAG